jgi:hypothetical protein
MEPKGITEKNRRDTRLELTKKKEKAFSVCGKPGMIFHNQYDIIG